MTPQNLREMLSSSILVSQMEDGLRVTTHCLYPSNGAVAVSVRGRREFVVSDDGGAALELSRTGYQEVLSDRRLKGFVRPQGLKVLGGIIFSPTVRLEAVPAAVMLVANASKEIADWGTDHLKFRVKRNFKADLAAILDRHYHNHLQNDAPIIGASNKPHHFGHVIYLSGDRRLIVDPVINDPGSINSRVVANMDVRMANDPTIEQIIVYDDEAKWQSSDLKLLELGARTVAFSQVESVVERLAA
jgi:hypothetical protein